MVLIPDGYGQVNFFHGGPQNPEGAEWTLGIEVLAYSGDPSDAADDIIANWTANLQDQTCADTTLLGVLVKFGPAETGPSAFVAASVQGTGGTVGTSPQVSYLVHKNTSFGGRAGRGRMFMPGVREDDVEPGGGITSARRTSLNNALVDFRSALIADNLAGVLLHGAGSPLSSPTAIDSFSVDARCATQRRRNRR